MISFSIYPTIVVAIRRELDDFCCFIKSTGTNIAGQPG